MEKSYTIKNLFLLALLFLSGSLMAQKTVSGKITGDDGSGLIGVSVVEKGTSNGTISDGTGAYSLKVGEKATLVFSFVGMNNVEIAVGNASSFDVKMEENAALTDELVITAGRQPVRKLESTMAVNVISAKQLETIKPEGIAEAIRGTPGMYVSYSQGRSRGAMFTRGFPDGSGNGLVYTGTLMDGLPTLATTARPSDFALSMDPNFERVEVVRGSTATLFGYSAAAGVVNMINRMGGTKHAGMARVTRYNNNVENAVNADRDRTGVDYRLDLNFNGPLAKNIRYNIGGFYLRDKGFRNLGYDDVGGQIRANVDYLFPENKGSVRVFAHLVDMTIQNMIDVPYRLSDNKPRDGWSIYDSYYNKSMDTINYTIKRTPENPLGKTDTVEVRSAKAANRDGNYARGFHIGANVDYSFGDGWKIANKFRYQSYNHGTKFNLGVSPYYTDANFSNVRILIDGDGVDADLMDEFRLEKSLEMGNVKHHISVGGYHSTGNYKADTWALTGWTPADKALVGFKGFGPGFRAATTGSASRNDKYTVNTNAAFLGDEMAIGPKLKITVGLRYDAINMDMYGFYRDTVVTGSNPLKYVTMNRKENYADWTASIGGNYLVNARTAIYGNFTRAYRMPDYGAFTPLKKAQVDPTNAGYTKTISNNEIVYNSELGFRSGFGDFNFDVSGFYTFIDNRLATIYEGAVATLKPLGNNDIRGAEIALNYSPQEVRGLNLSTSLTVQNAIFQSFLIPVKTVQSVAKDSVFGLTLVNQQADNTKKGVYAIDLQGKQLPRVPSQIFNAAASYDSKYWGFDASVNANMNMYNDATNLYKADNITWINVGAYVKYPLPHNQSMRLSLSVKNLLNTDRAERNIYGTSDDSALNEKQLVAYKGLDTTKVYYNGIPVMPRRILLTLDYKF
jgi:outer membrane receptor protein involved in Fe transport